MADVLLRPDTLRPLDFLLYRPTGVFGRTIKWHTGHNISHVEVFLGRTALGGIPACVSGTSLLAELDAMNHGPTFYSTASRDGKGVDIYPVRVDASLAYVMRPRVAPQLAQVQDAVRCALSMRGTPYGWLDLLDFFGFGINGKGIVCSPYATIVGRAAGYPFFNGTQARLVAPFQFRTSELLEQTFTDHKDDALDSAAA
jgi:hypothetical protein